jgi:hypothetical protein
MHELGAGAANDMFQYIDAQPGKTIGNETLPSGIFPLRMFQSISDRQQHETQKGQGFSLAEAVTDIAELSQPGISEVVDVKIVEGTDEPGQRHIPLTQPYERKNECAE